MYLLKKRIFLLQAQIPCSSDKFYEARQRFSFGTSTSILIFLMEVRPNEFDHWLTFDLCKESVMSFKGNSRKRISEKKKQMIGRPYQNEAL